MLGNCCDDTCTYVREKFNRANETPIASPWEKLLGNTWNLRDKLLDGLNTGTYRYNFAFPGAAMDARHASVRFRINSAGTTELLLAIAEDSFLGQPYDWFTAFVEYKSTGCSFLGANSFYHGAGYGALPGPSITNRVQCPSLTLNEWHRLEGCLIPNAGSYGYDGYNLIIAKLTCADGTIYSCQELSNTGQTLGPNGGLKFNRSGAIGSVEFDDYEETYYRNSPSGQHKTCPWCRTPCFISGDDFSIDRPCLWDLTAGSVTRGGGVMTMTSNGSQVQHHIFHPGLKTTGKVTVNIKDNGISTTILGTNGYAVLTLSGTVYNLVLRDRSGNFLASDTFTYTSPATNDPTKKLAAEICYSEGLLVINVTGHDGVDLCAEAAVNPFTNGHWVGLGGDAGAEFSDFKYYKTYETTEPADRDCDRCDGCDVECLGCKDNTAPALFKLTMPTDIVQNPAGLIICGCETAVSGTKILSHVATCFWRLLFSGTCGSFDTTMQLLFPGQFAWNFNFDATYRMQITMVQNGGTATLHWLVDLGPDRPDCQNFVDLEVHFSGQTFGSVDTCMSSTGEPILLTSL